MKVTLIWRVACVFVVLAGFACAQPIAYSLLRADGPQPTPRFDGTIVYDPIDRRIFLFGGQDNEPKNDLWAYSLAQRRWEEIYVEGQKPAPRFGHTLVFDSLHRRLVVFGGQSAGFFNDV